MERLNIYHRKDGRWEGRISRGKKDNGNRKFRYIFGKSKEQVRNKMKEILMSEASDNCSKTVQELFNEWLCSAKHRVKESTLANYRLKADKHILPFFGSQRITSVSSDNIYAFIDNKQSIGLSNRYIIDILIVMKSVFKHAVRTYHIINPMDGITMPKKGTSEIKLLESDEQHQLEQYISENRNNTTMGIALTMNVEGDHEAIIDPATFDLVQAMMEQRADRKMQYVGTGVFAAKIICSCCGGIYGSKVWHSGTKYRTDVWRCNNKYKKKQTKCTTPTLKEKYLKELFVRAFNELFKDKNTIIKDFEEIKDVVFDTSELESEQLRLQIEINDIAKSVENCIALNAHVAQNQEEYRQHYDSLVKKYEAVSEELQKVSDEIHQRRVRCKLTEHFLDELKKQKGTITEFSQDLLNSTVESITVYSVDKIVFKFKNGTEIEIV